MVNKAALIEVKIIAQSTRTPYAGLNLTALKAGSKGYEGRQYLLICALGTDFLFPFLIMPRSCDLIYCLKDYLFEIKKLISTYR